MKEQGSKSATELFTDNEPHIKQLQPIEVNELFPDVQEKEKQDKLRMSSSDMVTEDKSTFTAHVFKTG